MDTRKIGIVAGIAVTVAVIGALALAGNLHYEDVDKLAIDHETVDMLLSNNEQVLVVDIRSAEQYQEGHIKGTAHDILDEETLEKRVKTIQSRLPEIASSYDIILVDDSGNRAKQAAHSMTEMGIQAFYLEGGMENMSSDLEPHTQTIIDSKELEERLYAGEDLFLLDVREPNELLKSKIGNSVNIPLKEIFDQEKMNEIPKDKPVVVICGSGNRATIATYAMAQEGIDFQVLEDGIKAWDSFQESRT